MFVIGDHDDERALDLFIVEVVDNCASTVDDTRSAFVLFAAASKGARSHGGYVNQLKKWAHHRFIVVMLLSSACAVMLAIYNQATGIP